MKKLLRKKLPLRGFTLAELLIVVAIIAILVAVAIPIFTAQVERAKVATLNTGIRAVRAAAISQILGGGDSSTKTGYAVDPNEEYGWVATAQVSENGAISNLNIEADTSGVTDGVSNTASDYGTPSDKASVIDLAKGYFVQVSIKETEDTP